LFVPMAKDLNIDEILCIKHDRKTDNTGTFSFKNRCFQILDQGFPIISAIKTFKCLLILVSESRFHTKRKAMM